MPNITEKHAQALRDARQITDEKLRKRRKAGLFAEIKSAANIPSGQKIKFEIDDRSNPYYCAIKDGETGLLIEPAMPAYHGAHDPYKNAKPLEPKAMWPYPPGAEAGTAAKAVKAAPAGLDRVAPTGHIPAPQTAGAVMPTARLKLGSISLEDAASLLRVEADGRDTYATSEGDASQEVFVKNDRLFFVL